MSCNPCGPIVLKVYPNAPAVCPDTPEYVFSNANLTGEGFFLSHVGTNVQFKGAASSGGTIDITNDVANGVINFELDANIVAGNFPDATTVIKGKTAYATNAEALAKASTTKALTASNLAAMGSSTTFAGLTEYATNAETASGVSTTLAVTPAGLKFVTNTIAGTQVAVNDLARTQATPIFEGQLLYQTDTNVLYAAASTSDGDWELAAIPRTGTVDIGSLILQDVSGNITISFGAVTTNMTWFFSDLVVFDSTFRIGTSMVLDIGGVVVPAASVLVTAGLGTVSSLLINQFLTDQNTAEWTVSNVTPNRTFDANTADLAATRQALGTLLNDLAATNKPVYP